MLRPNRNVFDNIGKRSDSLALGCFLGLYWPGNYSTVFFWPNQRACAALLRARALTRPTLAPHRRRPSSPTAPQAVVAFGGLVVQMVMCHGGEPPLQPVAYEAARFYSGVAVGAARDTTDR